MNPSFLLLFLAMFFIAACSDSSGNHNKQSSQLNITCDTPNDIFGCWEPLVCEQFTTEENQTRFQKNIYSIRLDGSIDSEERTYSDSNCASDPELGALSRGIHGFLLGEDKIASDGTEAREMISLDFFSVTTVPEYIHYLYAILSTGELCITDNLVLLPMLSRYYPNADTETLNYDTCLQRVY